MEMVSESIMTRIMLLGAPCDSCCPTQLPGIVREVPVNVKTTPNPVWTKWWSGVCGWRAVAEHVQGPAPGMKEGGPSTEIAPSGRLTKFLSVLSLSLTIFQALSTLQIVP